VAIHVNELERDEHGTRKVELIASGSSPSGIEFYSWDFDYNADKKKFKPAVIMDKEGRQILTVTAGAYNIACKVVDNDGLENIEVVRLKVNGKVERG
jgi:hypothetical protein